MKKKNKIKRCFYLKIFKIINKIFGLKTSATIIRRPLGEDNWNIDTKKDYVYEVYITNYRKKDSGWHNLFGFWVTSETLFDAYKKAYKKVFIYYVERIKAFLKK